MRGEPSCPKCGGRVRAPGLFADSWRCASHGAVHPLQPVVPPSAPSLGAVANRSRVPVWMPWPLPVGWLFTGVTSAGSDGAGARATVLACRGPGPLGGSGELLLVAEESGVGLGARFAGVPEPDPDADRTDESVSEVRVVAAGRPTSLRQPRGAPDDRTVFVGESLGVRLWAVIWPERSGLTVDEELVLADLREAGSDLDLVPCGALSPRLLE
ncbi:DUF6758 family protein [Streptomyces profundus]|uniref:DUF6758 family protein n=1 Tax=Streptomyces profundus TaxID=2867410 RepID=UPI001D16D414|nr:DUF6758 family protein [Streptomyces sp. MA3_2.13]UED84328.1 hypothetical protein K4G22_09010 [Streptomyces sp. MA3_2.13]